MGKNINNTFLSKAETIRLLDEVEKAHKAYPNQQSDNFYAATAGVDRTTWYRWKTSKVEVPVKRAKLICAKLGIPLSDILLSTRSDSLKESQDLSTYQRLISLYKEFYLTKQHDSATAILSSLAVVISTFISKVGLNLDFHLLTGRNKSITATIQNQDTTSLCKLSFHEKEIPYIELTCPKGFKVFETFLNENSFFDLTKVIFLLHKEQANKHKIEARYDLRTIANTYLRNRYK